MKLRRGVVAVIRNEKGEVLTFERSDNRGVWQFPQGGVENGESPEDALLRELMEEVGTADVRIIKRSEGTTFYLWPEHRRVGRVNLYDGQEHIWFLCEFLPGAGPRLQLADGTFSAAEWTDSDNVVGRNVDWKRPSMSQGLRHLGIVS